MNVAFVSERVAAIVLNSVSQRLLAVPHSKESDGIPIPPRSRLVVDWFLWYLRGYLKKHFSAIRLAKPGLPAIPAGEPIIGIMNHPAWWDPIFGLVIIEHGLAKWSHYGAMDRDALESFQFFKRLGFFGVERGSARGAVRFLKIAQAILDQPSSALWLTPQGRYADARERPAVLMSGLSRLLEKTKRGYLLPLAIEYPFWDQRLPEGLALFGEPISLADNPGKSHDWWQETASNALMATQDQLANLAVHRDPNDFETLIAGKTGMATVYGPWRAMMAWWRGRSLEVNNPAPAKLDEIHHVSRIECPK
jgi:1-acyl-sn-glycerol-3-phosphate acyltransferase